MKISFVLPFAGVSGGIRVVAAYAQRLSAMGHQVTVISTPRKRPSLAQSVKSLMTGDGWIPPGYRSDSHLAGLEGVTWKVLERRRQIVDADVPDGDVIVATWWETAEWVAALSPSKGRKCYFIQHDERTWFPGDRLWSERVRATWLLPLHHLTIADWLAELLYAETGVRPPVIANSVDTDQFDMPARERNATPTVGFVYSTSRFKGTDIALEAIRLAREKLSSLQVVSFGSPDPQPDLPLPEGTRYERLPAQTRIPHIYADCDAWLFTSRFEGFGLPILEAMACRTPVIGAHAGAAPELLADGRGILLPECQSMMFAKAICALMSRPANEWKAMSESAYQHVHAYTWEHATQRFEAALLKAAGA